MLRLPATVLSLLLLLSAAAPAAASPSGVAARQPETKGSVRPLAVFDDPGGGPRSGRRIVDAQIRLIERAQKGGVIRLATFILNDPAAVRALIEAHRRGVAVRVVLDDRSLSRPKARRLIRELGRNPQRRSFVRVCRRACGGRRGIQHAKLMSVSTGKVVLIASSNVSRITRQSNDALIYRGHRRLYSWTARTLEQMLAQKRPRAGFSAPGISIYLPDGRRYRAARDPVRKLLSNVSCRVGGTRTSIRIAMWHWSVSRKHLATRLRKLTAAGCRVQVISSRHSLGRMGRKLAAPGRGEVAVRHLPDRWMQHGKVILIDGFDARRRRLRLLQAGSQNFTSWATGRSNEVTILTSDPVARRRYAAYFRHVLVARSHPVG